MSKPVSPSPRGGRPRKLTPEVIEAICVHIESARPFSTACRLEGQKPDTLRELMENHEDIRERIDRAKALGEQHLLGKLETLVDDDRKTAGVQWWMEKLYPKRWGRNAAQRIEQSGPDGKAMEVKLTIEEALAGARGDDISDE